MELTNYNKDKKVRRTQVDLGNMMFGKVPPQAKELEEAVLGAIMLERSAIDVAMEILRPECFYVDAHQRIFKAMVSLSNKSMPIDLLTVVEELKTKEELDLVGGPYFITKLTNHVVSSANIDAHSRIVLQKFMSREVIRIAGEMIGDAYDDSSDVFDLIDFAEKSIGGINENAKGGYRHVANGVVEAMKRIEDLRHTKKQLTGVETGFRDINTVTAGWQPTDLIVLAARPSVGKTAFALNLARNAASSYLQEYILMSKTVPYYKQKGVGFFSLEMSEPQLIQRCLSIESQLKLENISRGILTDDTMKDLYNLGAEPLSKLKIFIDDKSGQNIFQLRSKARKMVKNDNVGIIFIDYLQLMNGLQDSKNQNREQEIAKISRDLKGLAKELCIPIIALSQLSRDVEKRGGERVPVLSDLRESGAIEQDADIVMFMYRPDYYGKEADEKGRNLKGETHIKFAKHRSGALDTVKLRANLEIQRFFDFEGEPLQLGLGQGNWKPVFPTSIPTGNAEDDAPF